MRADGSIETYIEVKKYKHVTDLFRYYNFDLCDLNFEEILFNFISFDWDDRIHLFLFFNSNYIIKTEFKSRNPAEHEQANKLLELDYRFSFYLYELRRLRSFKFKNSNTLNL